MPIAGARAKVAGPRRRRVAHVKRLIDHGILGLEASVSGEAERYGRGKTSHTIHVWWARRPHGAMRALAFASLMTDGGREAEEVMRKLAFASSPDDAVINDAQRLLRSQYKGAPKVLDVFGGGGTIPYEAALLGADVSSIDYNPLSVFIQKSNLEFSQEAMEALKLNEVVTIVRESGERVLHALRMRTSDLFPLREIEGGKGVFAYFWSYRLRCNACGYRFLLIKRPWMSRKGGRRTALIVLNGGEEQAVAIDSLGQNDELSCSSVWKGRNGTACCPKCGNQHKNPSIRECSDSLVAIAELLKRGKAFKHPLQTAVPPDAFLEDREKRLLIERGLRLPETRLPRWSGIVNPSLYGIETHSDFLNKRQRLLLLELVGALIDERDRLLEKHSVVISRFVIATLSALIDQLVDWNCRLSMWISQNEQVGRAFCGPGVPMLWDYVETDPLLEGPANLWHKLDRIVAGVRATPRFAIRPKVHQGEAQNVPFGARVFDAVITDPPYYDNVYYNVLADFFYAWKRPLLESLCPELFRADQCGSTAELVASQFRQGKGAHQWYCAQLTRCLQEVRRVLKPNGLFSFVFAHSSLAAWEAIVQSFRRSGLVLTSAEPLSIERRQRPRAMTSEAINICIVLVGRQSPSSASHVDIATVEQIVNARARSIVKRLAECGWCSEDIGMAIFAQGVVAIANASSVTGINSDSDALKRVGAMVSSLCPGFKLQVRKSL